MMGPFALLLLVSLLTPSPELDELESRMVELINLEREARGIAPLAVSPELTEVARRYSEKMARAGEVHHDLDRPMEDRIRDALPDTCMFAENISKHTSVDYSIGDLMTSEGHRRNLLNPRYETMGVGIVKGDGGYLYITQEFARPCERRPGK